MEPVGRLREKPSQRKQKKNPAGEKVPQLRAQLPLGGPGHGNETGSFSYASVPVADLAELLWTTHHGTI